MGGTMASWPIPDTTAEFQRLILLAYRAHHMYNTHGPQRAYYELARLVEMAKTLKSGVDGEAAQA